jgi:chromosome segregation ATPase
MKNAKYSIKQACTSTDAASGQIMDAKTTITDLHIQATTNLLPGNNKYSQKQVVTQNKEKLLKDRLCTTLDQLEALNGLKNSINKNIRYTETYCYKFYDEAKNIFKKLKALHSEKLNELHEEEFKRSRFDNSSDGFGRASKARSVDPMKRSKAGDMSMDKLQRRLHDSGLDTSELGYNTSINNITVFKNTTKQQTSKNKSFDAKHVNMHNEEKQLLSKIDELNIKNQDLLQEINKLHETYIQTKSENNHLRHEIETIQRSLKSSLSKIDSHIHDGSSGCTSAVRLAEMTHIFIKKLAGLQDAINKKQIDVRELKQDFELKKKELILYANDIIANVPISEDFNNFEELKGELEVLVEEREQLMTEIKILNEKVISCQNTNKRFEEDNKKLLKEINLLKPINETMSRENKALKTELSNLEEELTIFKDSKSSHGGEIDKLKILNTNLEDFVKNLSKELEEKLIMINSLNKKLTENNHNNGHKDGKITELENELSELRDRYTELEAREKELGRKTKDKADSDNLNTKIASLNKELNENIQKLNLTEEQLAEYETELSEKNQKLINLSKDLDAANRKIAKMTENENKLRSQGQEVINNKITELQNDIDEMVTKLGLAEEQISENEKEIFEKDKRIGNLTRDIAELNKKVSKLTKDMTELKAQHEELVDDLQEQIRVKEGYIDLYEKEIKENQKHIKTIEGKLKLLEDGDKVNRSKETNEMKELRKTILELTQQNRDLEVRVAEFELKIEEYELAISEMKKTESIVSERKTTEIKKKEERIKQLEEKIKEQLSTITDLEDKIENYDKPSDNTHNYEDKIRLLEDRLKKEGERCAKEIQNYEERIRTFEEKLKFSDGQVSENEAQIQELQDKELEFDIKIQEYESKLTDMKTQSSNNLESKNNEIKKLNQHIFALEDIIAKNENEINELKNNELEMLDLRNRSSADEKLKSLNLQLTNKINQISAENTDIREEKERLLLVETNFHFVCSQINQFFERMVSVIQKLKNNTNIILPDEIEKRITELESEVDEYNLEFLDKDLEFAFLVIADIFEKYEEMSKSYDECMSKPNTEEMSKPSVKEDDISKHEEQLQLETSKPIDDDLIIQKDKKIKKYKGELKKMKGLFDECTQTIYEVIRSTAPNFVDEDLLLNMGQDNDSSLNSSIHTDNNMELEFIHKAVELFKAYNNEVMESNKALEIRLAESENEINVLKGLAEEYKASLNALLSSTLKKGDQVKNSKKSPKQAYIDLNKGRSFTVEDLVGDPEEPEAGDTSQHEADYIMDYSYIQKSPWNYKIVQEALYKEFRWFLVISKQLDMGVYDPRNVTWVPQGDLSDIDIEKDIEPTGEQFNEEDVTELINRNFDLEKEIKEKNFDIKSYKETIDKLLRSNNDQQSMGSKGAKTIPIEKYEMILKDLHEEQLRSEELERQYGDMKKTLDGYKSTINDLHRKSKKDKEHGEIDPNELLLNVFEKANKTTDLIGVKKSGLGLLGVDGYDSPRNVSHN